MNEQPAKFDQDQIDAYLTGRLDADLREQIEAARREDPGLDTELRFGEDMGWALKGIGREQLREEMAAWDAAMSPVQVEQPKRSLQIRPLWLGLGGLAVAAALALLFLLRGPKPVSPEQLLAQHVQPYPNLVVVVARSQAKDQYRLDSAFTAYEQGRYGQALELMQGLQDSLPASTLSFYEANALMMEGAYQKAYGLFQTVARIDTAPFQREARWYQGVLDIQAGRLGEGKTVMEEIANTEKHPFRKDAMEWLRSLP
ncbi:MAG: hypothetical protein AAFV07_11550 [Bacteroidota bacterium]